MEFDLLAPPLSPCKCRRRGRSRGADRRQCVLVVLDWWSLEVELSRGRSRERAVVLARPSRRRRIRGGRSQWSIRRQRIGNERA